MSQTFPATLGGWLTLASVSFDARMNAMQRSFLALSGVVAAIVLSGCDGYTYKGMDGRQALARANRMPLQQAYSFYLETYEHLHPPMLDVANTFSRFGDQGKAYLTRKALKTADCKEFEADLSALLIIDNRCNDATAKALAIKGRQLGGEALARQACGFAT